MASQIPPPSGQVLSLLTTLSNPSNHANHTSALEARDNALSSSPTSYGMLCLNFARILATESPDSIPPNELEIWSQSDGGVSVMQLRHDPTTGWLQLREMAGILLKNALSKPPLDASSSNTTRMRLPPEAAVEIKSILILCVANGNAGVRRVASSIVSSTSVGSWGVDEGNSEALPLKDWAELCPFLVHCMDTALAALESTGGAAAMEEKASWGLLGSLQTLTKILEDAPSKFERESPEVSFQRIVPNLLRLLRLSSNNAQSPGGVRVDDRVRRDALSCCVSLVGTMPPSLVIAMNDFLAVLSSLGNDPNAEVRKLVCRAIVTLLSQRTEYLRAHILPISQFILTATSDPDPDVSLEACEFWLTFGSLDDDVCTIEMTDAVASLLPQLLPTLVKGMVYTKDKIEELMEANALDEAEGEDRAQDLAPVFHRSKTKGGARKDESNADQESDDDDDDDDDEYDDREWTLRSCSAASLDTLASAYPHTATLPHLLPALQESLAHQDPWIREAGILALGAIADGCSEAMSVHMAQLHPYLMNQLVAADAIAQLKSITCWTLARYVDWAVEQVHTGQQPELIGKMTEAILHRVLDHGRKVQVAACSALGEIIERTGDMLVPYLEPIYRTLTSALGKYQTRALMVLFDTLGTMADFIGPAIGEGNLPGIYVPTLLALWSTRAKQNPFDRALLPLMESLASIALSIGMNFQPWALETFDGAMGIIESCMMLLSVGEYDDEDADPIVCATDLLDGMVEGLAENFPALVASSARYGEHFLNVVRTLTAHDISGVRMSAFALMGDLARKCPTVIQDGMGELLREAISCIDPMYPSVCNNAVWAIGEVCVKCEGNPAPLVPFAPDIVQGLIALLMGSASYEDDGYGMPVAGLAENAASTMGRLAKVNASFVAGDLPRFLNGWCDGMAKINDSTERKDAFEGFIVSVHANPESIKNASGNITDTITNILFAVVSWHIPPGNMSPDLLQGKYNFTPFPPQYASLAQGIGMLLLHLKGTAGEAYWGEVERSMPVNVRRLMRETYNL